MLRPGQHRGFFGGNLGRSKVSVSSLLVPEERDRDSALVKYDGQGVTVAPTRERDSGGRPSTIFDKVQAADVAAHPSTPSPIAPPAPPTIPETFQHQVVVPGAVDVAPSPLTNGTAAAAQNGGGGGGWVIPAGLLLLLAFL